MIMRCDCLSTAMHLQMWVCAQVATRSAIPRVLAFVQWTLISLDAFFGQVAVVCCAVGVGIAWAVAELSLQYSTWALHHLMMSCWVGAPCNILVVSLTMRHGVAALFGCHA